MKKALLILSVAVMFTSCNKLSSKRCWKCATSCPGASPVNSEYEFCDKSKSDINDIISDVYKIHEGNKGFTMECH